MRWLPVDLVLVSVFAAVGRLSHHEDLAPGHWWHTAWPFLVGALVGWLLVTALRRTPGALLSGLLVVVATVAVGMALRALTGQGTAVSFVIVASAVTTLLLVGARLLARVVRRRPVSAAPR